MILFIFLGCSSIQGKNADTSQGDRPVDSNDNTSIDLELEQLQSIPVADLPQADVPCREPVLGFVQHVVDGDTAFIETDYGEEKVRFIGVDAPEVGYNGGQDECYSQQSKLEANSILQDRWVWLSFDETCQDYYGRTLAYVSTGLGIEGFFQRRMLRRGFVQHFPFDSTPSYINVFDEDERMARDLQQGGWSDCGWR